MADVEAFLASTKGGLLEFSQSGIKPTIEILARVPQYREIISGEAPID